MDQKQCRTCKETKSVDFFHSRKDTGKFRSDCKECFNAANQRRYQSQGDERRGKQREWYEKNRVAVLARNKTPESRERANKWRLANRDEINAKRRESDGEIREKIQRIKLESGCVDCGYNANPYALDFDHLPGFVKSFDLARCTRKSWQQIQKEIGKCEVVCANCHRLRTANRREEVTCSH